MAYPRNSVIYTQKREIDSSFNTRLRKRLHVTNSFIDRLGLERELHGHEGCVNCLEWNMEGRILASASDDFKVILWDPFLYKNKHTIETGHQGNIFSVKFLPKSNDNIILTGAGDWQVRVHDVQGRETLNICNCPKGRVKRLATAPHVPHLFWSAAEDGGIRQFDLRIPHSCSESAKNILVYLRTHMGDSAEAKCLAVNPCQPEILAVGANDPFIRLYDRRMIKLTGYKGVPPPPNGVLSSDSDEEEVENNLLPGCVQYFVAGHLEKVSKNLAATYVTYGPNGVDLLANLGGEQIYLFDTSKKRKPKSFELLRVRLPKEFGGLSNCDFNGINGVYCSSGSMNDSSSYSDQLNVISKKLPEPIENMKLDANIFFENGKYSSAINIYNEAILRYSNCAVLYGNRAAALMKRNWDGDMYAALRDCHLALHYDPNYVKAFFRLARCLYELKWKIHAKECLEAFKIKFPGHASSYACKALEKDMNSPSDSTDNTNSCPNGHISMDDEPHEGRNKSMKLVFKSLQEYVWCGSAFDYEKRYYGHCNTTTDIKEANFFGSDGQYIMAGSDDGSIYFWDRKTTNNVRILRGDDSIVNCLQPHPSCCLLATSGIDPVVRLWSPKPEDGSENDREVKDREMAAYLNQKRMKTDPFDVVLTNMGYRNIFTVDFDSIAGSSSRAYDCRTS